MLHGAHSPILIAHLVCVLQVAVHLDTAQKMMMVIEAKAADVARHTPMVRWEKWTSGVGALTPKTIRRFFELHARALSSLKAMRRALRVLETSDHYARFWYGVGAAW